MGKTHFNNIVTGSEMKSKGPWLYVAVLPWWYPTCMRFLIKAWADESRTIIFLCQLSGKLKSEVSLSVLHLTEALTWSDCNTKHHKHITSKSKEGRMLVPAGARGVITSQSYFVNTNCSCTQIRKMFLFDPFWKNGNNIINSAKWWACFEER